MTMKEIEEIDVGRESARLAKEIRPLFAEEHPVVVGSTLAELCARMIAMYHPDQRTSIRAHLIKLMDDLVPIIINDMVRSGKVSADWQRPSKH